MPFELWFAVNVAPAFLQVLVIENVTILTTETRVNPRTAPWISRSAAVSASLVTFRKVSVRGLQATNGKMSRWVSFSNFGFNTFLELVDVDIKGNFLALIETSQQTI